MKPLSRILALGASLLMIGGLFLPLWQIDLAAPQYPEGLGMKIWIDKLSGDVDIINGLNHYIGMKHIKAEMFPEFAYMKYILMGLIGFGFLVVLIGKKPVLYTWFVLLAIAAAAGMYDFWRWEYDYGHNLDPRAAIIVPGMSYQPPLWGYKDLLNFRAGSFPDTGGWAIIWAGFIVLTAVVLEMFYYKKAKKSTLNAKATAQANAQVNAQAQRVKPYIAGTAAMLLLFSACSSGPQPIAYGKDGCEHCKMTIMDPRFGAELLNKQGKAYKFDSGECMIGYLKEGRIEMSKVSQLLVTDFANPETLIDAKTAHYLHSEAIPSPMGANVSAFSTADARAKAQAEKGGDLWTWDNFYSAAGAGMAMGQMQ